MSGSATLAHCKRRRGLVTLTWLPPLSGSAQTYHIEAGSFAGGSNLASFNTGTASAFFSRAGVPAGVYYIRIRTVAAGCAPSARRIRALRHHHGQCPDGAGAHNGKSWFATRRVPGRSPSRRVPQALAASCRRRSGFWNRRGYLTRTPCRVSGLAV